jgi:type I restriction enzyme S subunit
LLSGSTPSRSTPAFWGGAVPWISAKSLKRFEVIDSEDRLTDAGARGTAVVAPGSVLFVVRGMSLANEFRVGVAGRELTFDQDVRALVPRPDVDGRYLARFLQAASGQVLGLVDEASHGTKRLTSDRFGAIQVPLPSLVEQRRIAEILDKADALRTKRRAALAQLDTLTQSIFLDMFGDPSSILGRWPNRNLGTLLEFLTSGSRGWAEHYSDAGDLFLRIQNVKRDELSLEDTVYVRAPATAEAKRTRVEPGDVLLSFPCP